MPDIIPPAIADLCDRYEEQDGVITVVSPLFRDYGAVQKFAGGIATVRCCNDNSKVREQVALPGEGRILVIDGGASMHCALLGGNLAAMAAENNWNGIVINGCVRDCDELKDIRIGIRALASTPRRSEKRQSGVTNVPVYFANACFTPGHFLYADSDGMVLGITAL